MPQFPIIKRAGSVAVKIYRIKRPRDKGGETYTISWISPEGRRTAQRNDLAEAAEEAQLKADQLARGLSESEHLTRSDVQELAEARRLAGDFPLLSAMKEWSQARDIAGSSVVQACREFAEKRKRGSLKRVTLTSAIEEFIEAKKPDCR